jgi:putative ABC transport system permease protein
MALGLVAAGIIFIFVYQEFNYDVEVANSEDIYRIIQTEGEQQSPYTFSPLAEVLKTSFPEIESVTRVNLFYGYLACSANDNKFNETTAIFADPNFFSLFPFPLILGNSKECLISPNSVVISESAAKKYYGNTDPIGQVLRIGEHKEITVTGVFQDFRRNSNFQGDLIFPLEKISKLTQIWIGPSWEHESEIHTFVRLHENSNIEDLEVKAKNLVSKYKENSKHELSFQQLKNIHIESQLFWESVPQANVKYLKILVAVALIILIISSANFLFLYIGTTSQHIIDTGIKKVCGASKPVLFLEHFREVLAMMFISCIVAIFFFIIYSGILSAQFQFLPQITYFDYKLGILLFAIVVTIAFLAGIYPSIVLSSQKPIAIFNTGKTLGTGKTKLVNLLVIGQFTMCITLMVTTFIMYKQTTYLEKQETGIAKEELITIPLNMHLGQGIFNETFDVFTEELKKNPGIKNVTLGYATPASVNIGDSYPNWEGKSEGKEVEMYWSPVSYGYFETLGLKIIKGRTFSKEFPADEVSWEKRTSNYILNEKAVQEMGIIDPIGKQFEIYGFKGQIVGIVEDYNFRSLHSEISPLYFQVNSIFMHDIIVRINPLIPTVQADIKKVWSKFVHDYPVEINYVSDQVRELYKPEQNLASTLNIFSIIAILISCMGLFTLTVLTTNKRIKEIGIRKVNGARISEILSMLNKDFIKWVAIAFVVACPIAYYTMQKWLENFAYKTELNWWIFALAGVLALGIALLTVSWQSWRAATRNPVEALRYE